MSGNVLLNIIDDGEELTSAPVFVLTSNHPIISSWVDGHVSLSDSANMYDYDVTELDNIITDVAFGTYDYTFTKAGGCYPPVSGSLVVDCDAINDMSGNVLLNIIDDGAELTSAPVFILTSNHPIIGSWVDGHVSLSDSANTYEDDVSEFDNIIADVAFGTYDYTFIKAGGCYPSVTGSLVVGCDAIDEMSGNVLLNVLDDGEEITSAPVFVLTSNHPIIGSWVDGHVSLSGSTNVYEYDVTEFDNIIADVVFGTYDYTFTKAGGCYPSVTGSLVVDCDATDEMSGNVLLNVLDDGAEITSSPIFILTSNHPIIGSWVDGYISLSDSANMYEYDVSEFDNIIADIAFGTYDYSFTQSGGCYPSVTGSLLVDCDAIEGMSGNVLLNIIDEGTQILIDTSITQVDAELTANATGVTYQWVDCNNDNQPIEGETNQVFTATSNGSYAVAITDTVCFETLLSSCIEVISLANKNIESSINLSYYPNPVTEIIYIEFNTNYKNIDIQIYSSLGQLVRELKVSNSIHSEINVSDFLSGSYILKVQADNKGNSFLIIKK